MIITIDIVDIEPRSGKKKIDKSKEVVEIEETKSMTPSSPTEGSVPTPIPSTYITTQVTLLQQTIYQ